MTVTLFAGRSAEAAVNGCTCDEISLYRGLAIPWNSSRYMACPAPQWAPLPRSSIRHSTASSPRPAHPRQPDQRLDRHIASSSTLSVQRALFLKRSRSRHVSRKSRVVRSAAFPCTRRSPSRGQSFSSLSMTTGTSASALGIISRALILYQHTAFRLTRPVTFVTLTFTSTPAWI